jgi:thioredoxin reductase
MTALLVGDAPAAAGLLESLREAGLHASVAEPAEPADPGEIRALAHELLRFESSLGEARPSAVLLVDGGNSALAAALVATKLLVPVATVGAEADEAENSALLAQLADRKLSADAGEILAWIEAVSTLRGD